VAGHSNRAIAEHLVISVWTVKSHLTKIYRKLDVASRTQAVARAHELGLGESINPFPKITPSF
jgi:ATP/maltotriose-dependent transcriptional regulator MalT